MFNIKTMNKIAAVGLERLPAESYTVGDAVENEDGILVRSAKLHDYDFPASLWAIARAGAGSRSRGAWRSGPECRPRFPPRRPQYSSRQAGAPDPPPRSCSWF